MTPKDPKRVTVYPSNGATKNIDEISGNKNDVDARRKTKGRDKNEWSGHYFTPSPLKGEGESKIIGLI